MFECSALKGPTSFLRPTCLFTEYKSRGSQPWDVFFLRNLVGESCFLTFSSQEEEENENGKETILERADFTLQLLMFVTAEKKRELFIFFFLSSFCQLLSP